MKTASSSRFRTWLCVFLASLGIHYLMLVISHIIISGGFSPSALWQLAVDRLTQPGDATRYLDIAANGYVKTGENAINLVFYPLYPLLIRLLGYLTGLPLAGVLISQCSFGAASVVLYEWILLDGDEKNAWDGVLLLSLYPFSVFVMGVFSEGTFLLLTLSCLYCLRKQNFLWAGILGFLAALCRTQGMLLLFPAVCELLLLRLGEEKRRFRASDCAVLLIPAGFGIYLLINYALHGNFFQFLAYEAAAPWYQSTKWVGENLRQHYEMALNYPGLDLIIYWPQLILYFAVLGVLLLGLYRKERLSYILYGGVYLGFSYLSGWMISGGRYMLCCVPIYLILAKFKNGWAKKLIVFAAALFFFLYSLLYYKAFAIM